MSPPDRSRRRWENIIKADLDKGLVCKGFVYWINSARYKFQLLTLVNSRVS